VAVYEYDLREILPRVQGLLREILEQELAAGNHIVEIAGGWPLKNANIWLASRFHEDYRSQFPMVSYRYLGDPKVWVEEYVDEDRGLMIAVTATVIHPAQR